VILVDTIMKKRSNQQNKALHRLFELIADDLNNQGLTVKKTLRDDFDMMWTKTLIKEIVWKKIQKAMYGTESTADLTTQQIDKIFDVINKHLGEKHHIHIPFPSIETLIDYEESKEKQEQER